MHQVRVLPHAFEWRLTEFPADSSKPQSTCYLFSPTMTVPHWRGQDAVCCSRYEAECLSGPVSVAFLLLWCSTMTKVNLRKREFILAYDSRGIWVHHGMQQVVDVVAGALSWEITSLKQSKIAGSGTRLWTLKSTFSQYFLSQGCIS